MCSYVQNSEKFISVPANYGSHYSFATLMEIVHVVLWN
jgi:hypothetical protein